MEKAFQQKNRGNFRPLSGIDLDKEGTSRKEEESGGQEKGTPERFRGRSQKGEGGDRATKITSSGKGEIRITGLIWPGRNPPF